MTLSKNYDPKTVEQRLYASWEDAGYFHEEPDPARPPFIICMPPPNVTGRAHLGHGSTYGPMDTLVRFHRMLGENADWLPGLDHAAIATEAALLKELAKAGQDRQSLGREAYLKRAWEWSELYGGTINAQFRRLGFGPDWHRARFTMDQTLSAAVHRVFVQLYNEGLIYRGTRLVNWDPKAKSTISDAEIEHVERETFLWRVRYPFSKDDTNGIEIATTRPETILGDVAIAVQPDDARYRHLIGKTVLVPPMLERAIPIVADAVVDPAFGTGAVKVTPAHDQTDYEIGQRHNLPMPSIIDLDAKIASSDISVGRYAGMDRFDARKAIVDDLKSSDFLIDEQPYRHAVATSERTGEIIEPLLSLQWFVQMKPLAEPALQAYYDGEVRFIPERYGRTYESWLTNIRDWNISRQVWWGHQLPVWYTPNDDIIVAESEEDALKIARERYDCSELRRDPDTLDTWFSSGLWPFSILGWPEQTEELAHWYPSSVLITGGDIIFLWVARMVMLGKKFIGRAPFPEVFVAPLVFDAQGRKMSKSLGNALDPLELVEKFGADAFRLGMMRQMRLEGQEVRFQESRCEEARNFNNKIWNATRYILSLAEGLPSALKLPKVETLGLADRWILTRLHQTARAVTDGLGRYDFGTVAEMLWKFIWYEFCDWYIEATKAPSPTRAAVLSFVLNNAMRLLHPIEPFITEEIWLALPHDGRTIMTAQWPELDEIPLDLVATTQFEHLQRTAERIRNLRAEMGLAPRAPLTLEIPANVSPEMQALLGSFTSGTVELVDAVGGSLEEALAAVTARAPRGVVLERHRKDAARLVREVERGEQKLANQQFIANAKPGVVANEREKLENYRTDLLRVRAALAEMGEIA
ncbi:MAG: valine--tRNA ligase [Candidatus Eremiobacteraeota bacterium]|nr:valine--tRNA ligase [Candidatus Eremiobacteraeota bacterium]